MAQVARERVPGGDVRVAAAEELPFPDGSFERAVMRLAVHLVDRPRALAELRRVLVPAGRLVVQTYPPEHFDAFWLNGLFPSLAGIDRERFPLPEQLEADLRSAGFGEVRLLTRTQEGSVTREAALRKIRGRYISTLELLDEDEYAAGSERAERELPDVVRTTLHWLVAVAA
jgi:SAM-dependent methyltransferase